MQAFVVLRVCGVIFVNNASWCRRGAHRISSRSTGFQGSGIRNGFLFCAFCHYFHLGRSLRIQTTCAGWRPCSLALLADFGKSNPLSTCRQIVSTFSICTPRKYCSVYTLAGRWPRLCQLQVLTATSTYLPFFSLILLSRRGTIAGRLRQRLRRHGINALVTSNSRGSACRR